MTKIVHRSRDKPHARNRRSSARGRFACFEYVDSAVNLNFAGRAIFADFTCVQVCECVCSVCNAKPSAGIFARGAQGSGAPDLFKTGSNDPRWKLHNTPAGLYTRLSRAKLYEIAPSVRALFACLCTTVVR